VIRHFITELHLGIWTAWEVGLPLARFVGDTPANALRALFNSLGLDHASVCEEKSQRPDRLEFIVPYDG